MLKTIINSAIAKMCIALFAGLILGALFPGRTHATVSQPSTLDAKLSEYWKAAAIEQSLRAEFAESLTPQQRDIQQQAAMQSKAKNAARAEAAKACGDIGKDLVGLDTSPFKGECGKK